MKQHETHHALVLQAAMFAAQLRSKVHLHTNDLSAKARLRTAVRQFDLAHLTSTTSQNLRGFVCGVHTKYRCFCTYNV